MKKIVLICGMVLLSMSITWSQNAGEQHIPLIGSEAPSFEANSTNGKVVFPDDFGDSWKIILSHPKDHTPVCSSEILELAYRQEDFSRLNTKLIVLSTDNIDSHVNWKMALEQIAFKGRDPVKINLPLVEDETHAITTKYGMNDQGKNIGKSIRGVFFVDPENKIRAFYFYPNEVGRNIDEIQRTLVALQTNYGDERVVLPVNWQPGEDVMLSYLDESELAQLGKPGSKLYSLIWFMNYMKTK
jgi:peroxiredoxin (alkyl hydroperoxide reductase subunit C)